MHPEYVPLLIYLIPLYWVLEWAYQAFVGDDS